MENVQIWKTFKFDFFGFNVVQNKKLLKFEIYFSFKLFKLATNNKNRQNRKTPKTLKTKKP
jgi:hypothetical protein